MSCTVRMMGKVGVILIELLKMKNSIHLRAWSIKIRTLLLPLFFMASFLHGLSQERAEIVDKTH